MIQAFRVFVFLGTCILFSSVAAGQPLINTNGVVNAASFAGTPAGGAVPLIAPGSIFSIFGKALGPATGVSASALPLPVSLPASNGTSVRVTSGNTTVNAYIFYSSATQINAILPSTASVGSATVTVSFGGQTSDPQKIWIVPSSFGVFTKNRAGFGPAIVQNFVSPSNTPVNGLATAAKSGQTVILYGTGLGAIAGPDNVAPGAVSAGPGTVEINVAGKTIRPVYAGRSPEYPGLDQINFVLESPPTGCYIPLQVRAGNSVSNITTISVASNQSYCESTLGLSEAALRRLDDGGAVTLGGVGVTRINLFLGLSTDVALGLFARADADLAFRAAMLTDLGSLIYPVAVGSCVIFDQATAPEASLDLLTLLARAMPLSAGTKFTLSGKATVDLPRAPNGLYQNEGLAQFLSGGKWTMSGAGGSEVGAFSVSTTISPLITWIGPQEGEIARNSLRFTWSGGGSAPEDVVYLSGYSTIVNRVDPYQSQGKRFQCTAPAGPGSFTVPSVITAQLPAAPAESPSTAYFGSVGFSTRGGSPFTSAPLTAGGSIDGGVFAWVVRDERTVTFK